jgi:hypothetical protein
MPDLRVLHLATNELACIFETDTGFLRKIVHGETEIVRAIYAAVRDENWNTVEPAIEVRNVHVEQNEFRVDFDALCQAAGICLVRLRLMDRNWSLRLRAKLDPVFAKTESGFVFFIRFANVRLCRVWSKTRVANGRKRFFLDTFRPINLSKIFGGFVGRLALE